MGAGPEVPSCTEGGCLSSRLPQEAEAGSPILVQVDAARASKTDSEEAAWPGKELTAPLLRRLRRLGSALLYQSTGERSPYMERKGIAMHRGRRTREESASRQLLLSRLAGQ